MFRNSVSVGYNSKQKSNRLWYQPKKLWKQVGPSLCSVTQHFPHSLSFGFLLGLFRLFWFLRLPFFVAEVSGCSSAPEVPSSLMLCTWAKTTDVESSAATRTQTKHSKAEIVPSAFSTRVQEMQPARKTNKTMQLKADNRFAIETNGLYKKVYCMICYMNKNKFLRSTRQMMFQQNSSLKHALPKVFFFFLVSDASKQL